MKEIVCQICNKQSSDILPASAVSPSVVDIIKKSHKWNPSEYICQNDLDEFRYEYIQTLLKTEKGELSKLDEDVLKSMNKKELLSKNIETYIEKNLSLGQRVADKLASFGGSWRIFTGTLSPKLCAASISLRTASLSIRAKHASRLASPLSKTFRY